MAIEPSFAQTQQIEALPTPNLPLLRKVLDHIDVHPEEWNQSDWFVAAECGTAHCIAGHAVQMTQGVKVNEFGELVPLDGRLWGDAAMDALGLTHGEARGLFYHANTRADVQRHAEAIAARGGERL